MREQTVVADRDAEATDEIERDGQDHVAQVDRVAPQQWDRDRQRDHRADDEQCGDDPSEEEVPRIRRCFGGALV